MTMTRSNLGAYPAQPAAVSHDQPESKRRCLTAFAQIIHACALQVSRNGDRDPSQIGGYRTPVISRPSQRVTVIAVTGQAVRPRLRRSR